MFFAFTLCLFGLSASQAQSAERPPNVVLVLTDDQGFGDVRSHGNKLIDTPVHDRIAAEGVRFDRFFVSPVCAPTRASLLTGRYHIRTGVHGVTRGHEIMRANEVTIAERQWSSLIPDDTPPPIHLNAEKMERFRPLLEPLRYDPSRYDTYLEQLGITYPTFRRDQGR